MLTVGDGPGKRLLRLAADAYGFDRAGDQLLISTANGVLTFNSTPILDQTRELQNVTWYMVSYEALKAIPGSNPTAIFAADGTDGERQHRL